MEKLKICSECKHSDHFRLGDWNCYHPKSLETIDHISGRETYKKCDIMRKGECGKEGYLYKEYFTVIGYIKNLFK